MGLRDRLAENRQPFDAVVAVATCRNSLFFADLCWPPFDMEADRMRLIEGRDPGVIFEPVSRVVVLEEHSGELRYYAGGWRSDESRIYLEQDRIEAEGSEMGVFRTLRDAMIFTERYLVGEQALQDIEAAREVIHRRETITSRAEPGAAADRPCE
jgi:hypothetical protein